MTPEEFDPLAYIENAFLDKSKREVLPESGELSVAIPSISDYLNKRDQMNGHNGREGSSATAIVERVESHRIVPSAQALIDDITVGGARRTRFKKTLMSAPRPRRSKSQTPQGVIDPELQSVWETLPKSIEFLCSFYDDSVTANYYGGNFKESRNALVKRLLDPELSLEETSRLLGVCPATVRRYTNRNWLTHHRTDGGQRRFRLSDIVKFVEAHGRFPEE
jgi:excisionase family DNA binding protein